MTIPTTPYTTSLIRTARYRQLAWDRVLVVAPAWRLLSNAHWAAFFPLPIHNPPVCPFPLSGIPELLPASRPLPDKNDIPV